MAEKPAPKPVVKATAKPVATARPARPMATTATVAKRTVRSVREVTRSAKRK